MYLISILELAIANSIISNKGFIRQMSGGGNKLNPTHVAVWGGMVSTGQFVGVGILQLVTDRLGRKKAMHVTWITLLIVRCKMFLSLSEIYLHIVYSQLHWRQLPQIGSTGYSPG